jgi:hypothetical protein
LSTVLIPKSSDPLHFDIKLLDAGDDHQQSLYRAMLLDIVYRDGKQKDVKEVMENRATINILETSAEGLGRPVKFNLAKPDVVRKIF